MARPLAFFPHLVPVMSMLLQSRLLMRKPKRRIPMFKYLLSLFLALATYSRSDVLASTGANPMEISTAISSTEELCGPPVELAGGRSVLQCWQNVPLYRTLYTPVNCDSYTCSLPMRCIRLVLPCGQAFDSEFDYCADMLNQYWADCHSPTVCKPGGRPAFRWKTFSPLCISPADFCGIVSDACCCVTKAEYDLIKCNIVVIDPCQTCMDCATCEKNCVD